jgi:hypothetical protein
VSDTATNNTNYLDSLQKLLAQPVAKQLLSEAVQQLGLGGSGWSLEGLGGGILSSLGSILPGLMGDAGNPALNWMASDMAGLGSQALLGSGVFSPSYQAIAGWGAPAAAGAEAFAGGASTLAEAGENLAASLVGSTAGASLGQILSMAAPVLALATAFKGDTDWTNPYASYASNIPFIGGQIASVIELLNSKDLKAQHKIEQALIPIKEASTARLQALRDAGYTDWDIYNYAQANNLYTESTDIWRSPGSAGTGGAIGGLYTPAETNQIATVRGADAGGGAPIGWMYGDGKWTQYSSSPLYAEGSDAHPGLTIQRNPDGSITPIDPYAQTYQTATPSNLTSYGTVAAGMDGYTWDEPGLVSIKPEDLLGYSTSTIPWQQTVENPEYDPVKAAKAKEWQDAYNAQWANYNYTDGGWYPNEANPYAYNVPETITTNIWDMTPEQQIQLLLDQNGNRTGTTTTPSALTDNTFYGTPAASTTPTTPTTPAVDAAAPDIDYSKLGYQGDMSVFDQYMRQNPQYVGALQGNTASKRLQAPNSVPTFASTPNVGNWVNEDAWKNIWGKTFYPQSNYTGAQTTTTSATSANPSSQDTWKKIFGNTFYGGSSGF